MGEMADYHLDSAFVDPHAREFIRERVFITCRCCKQDGLHWGELDNGKWRLFTEENVLHACPARPLKGGG